MGSTFKFVHCADLHLGGRFKGVSAGDPELGRRMRESLFLSFERIVDLAVTEDADALIISGDVYDDANELPSTRARFASTVGRLKVPVFVCRGNHDFSQSWDSAIPYPENVTEFGDEPSMYMVDSKGGRFAVTGVSFRDPHDQRDLAGMLRGHPDLFTVACVHCDVDSASEGYAYAPCKLSELSGRGIGYWALGHIHARNVLSDSPYVVYPGNIQGRSIKETGEKGAYVVTVTDGRVSELRFVPTQEIVWNEFEVPIDGMDMESLASGLPDCGGQIVRLRFVGRGGLDAMLRSETADVMKVLGDRLGCVMLPPKLECGPETEVQEGNGLDSVLMEKGRQVSELPAEGILDIILGHKMAGKYSDFYSGLDESELRAMAREATAKLLAAKKVAR